MLSRKPSQARFEVDLPGITNEKTFSDTRRIDYTDETDYEQIWLDTLEYRTQRASDPVDPSYPDVELDREAQTVDPITALVDGMHNLADGSWSPEVGSDEDGFKVAAKARRIVLPEAVKTLTDRQTIAVWLMCLGYTQSKAARYMGIAQATYYETLFGKDGVGGAIPRLRKYFREHPITLS